MEGADMDCVGLGILASGYLLRRFGDIQLGGFVALG